jgi:hypothetical protein
VDAVEAPGVRPLLRNLALDPCEEERRERPTVRCLHLDQRFLPCRLEREDVETGAVAVLGGYPANLLGQVATPRRSQALPLDREDELLACLTEGVVAAVTLNRVELVDQAPELRRRWAGSAEGAGAATKIPSAVTTGVAVGVGCTTVGLAER